MSFFRIDFLKKFFDHSRPQEHVKAGSKTEIGLNFVWQLPLQKGLWTVW